MKSEDLNPGHTGPTKPTEDVPSENLNYSYSDEEVNYDESIMMKYEDLNPGHTGPTKPTEDIPSKENLNNSYSDEEVNDDESTMMKSDHLMQAIQGQHTQGLQT